MIDDATDRTPARNPVLAQLDRFVGEWDMTVPFERGMEWDATATFEWLEDRSFLVHRTTVDDLSKAPTGWVENAPHSSVWLIGVDETTEQFTALYADSRDVFRVYDMRLGDDVWELWRDAPGFSQRFTGTFHDDGNTIDGRWERTDDGIEWEIDFDVSYTKISG